MMNDERGVNMRTVRVKWKGPLSLNDVKELDDDDDDCGLYQIYGRHIIFGDDSLLYVGMTTSTFNRRFFSGSDPHIDWLEEEEGVSVYVGRIAEEDYEHDPPHWSDWENVLKDAEALTIYWHSPPYNSSNIESYNGQTLRIINDGGRGNLCERLPFEDANYLLTVIQGNLKTKTGKIIQCDEFYAVNKKIKLIQYQALNKVLRKELRELFKKSRWERLFGVSYKGVKLNENESALLVVEPASENKPGPVAMFLAQGVKIE